MVISDPIKSSISSEPSGRNNPSHIPRIRNDGSFYKVGVLSILLGFKNKGTQITGLVFTVYDFKALKSDLDA
ncbi:hypothetical protein LPYR103PRE_22220 [Segatella asaccharophila]|jgi:hypothetical protein